MNRENLKVAIVGSGPASLYAAEELLKREKTAHIDLYDRLPTPGGLVRAGVSPDHGQRRTMADRYVVQLFASGRFRFYGNVEVGKEISLDELREHYHAVIVASGAAADRQLGIPGEHLNGSVAATEFVAWYNGHPDYADRQFDLSGERAVVIGNGNVALDVARMLLLPQAQLAKTDIADHALEALASSNIREVVLLGRRGPAQAQFTLPELLELQHMPFAIGIEGSFPDTISGNSQAALRLQTLQALNNSNDGAERKLIFKFLHSPLEVLGDDSVAGLRAGMNTLSEDGNKAIASGEETQIDTGLVVRAVGYHGEAVEGLPYDAATGTIPSAQGRVEAGTYVAGWLKRGPRGVIGTNKHCSRETVAMLLEDWRAQRLGEATIQSTRELLLERGARIADIAAWRRIDNAEISRGISSGRPRVKIANRDELLRTALV